MATFEGMRTAQSIVNVPVSRSGNPEDALLSNPVCSAWQSPPATCTSVGGQGLQSEGQSEHVSVPLQVPSPQLGEAPPVPPVPPPSGCAPAIPPAPLSPPSPAAPPSPLPPAASASWPASSPPAPPVCVPPVPADPAVPSCVALSPGPASPSKATSSYPSTSPQPASVTTPITDNHACLLVRMDMKTMIIP